MMDAIRHTETGEMVLILNEIEADGLLAALRSNANCPEMDDLQVAMSDPREVDIFSWTSEP